MLQNQRVTTGDNSYPDQFKTDALGDNNSEGVDIVHEPPAFPIESLSPKLKAVTEDVARVYNVPISLPAMTTIAVVSGAIGRHYMLTGAWNGKDTYGNIMAALVAETGSGKGCISSILAKPLTDFSREIADEYIANKLPNLKSQVEILQAKKKKCLNELKKGKFATGDDREVEEEIEKYQRELDNIIPDGKNVIGPPYLCEGDATSEALIKALSRNNGITFSHSSEAAELLRSVLGRYADKCDFGIYLKGYSSEEQGSNRVSSGRVSFIPTISALWFMQPIIIEELAANREVLERGFAPRLLIANTQATPKVDDGIVRKSDFTAHKEWETLIRDLISARLKIPDKEPEPIIVQCSEEARNIFRHFHNESVKLGRGEYADIRNQLTRWRENATRIGLLLWIADGKGGELTKDQAARAVKVVQWCFFSWLPMLSECRMEKKVERINRLRDILAAKGGEIFFGELRRNNNFHPEELQSLAKEFPMHLKINEIKPRKEGGRPGKSIRVITQ